MSKRDLVSAALRVVGVVMFAYTLAGLPMSVHYIHMMLAGTIGGLTNVPLYVFLSVLSILLSLGIGLGLVLRGDAVARLIERDDSKVDMKPAEWLKPGLIAALRVVGVIMVAYAIPQIVRVFASSLFEVQHVTGNAGLDSLWEAFGGMWRSHWPDVIGALVTIAIGVYLAFGSPVLARLMLCERRQEEVEEPDA